LAGFAVLKLGVRVTLCSSGTFISSAGDYDF
jgi:hypothetical protein